MLEDLAGWQVGAWSSAPGLLYPFPSHTAVSQRAAAHPGSCPCMALPHPCPGNSLWDVFSPAGLANVCLTIVVLLADVTACVVRGSDRSSMTKAATPSF